MKRNLCILALGLVACGSSQASTKTPNSEPTKPVCLVLSVGAHHGLSHIGVIEQLQEQGVSIDCVVGTSMGSMVGALYASAPDADLRERYRSYFLSYKRQTQSDVSGASFAGLLFGGALAVATGGASLAVAGAAATGALVGAGSVTIKDLRRMESVMDAYFEGATIESLPVPYRTMCQELSETGASLEPLATGPLATAVAASIANPLLFPNVRIGKGERIDPGLNPIAAVPLRYACSQFPDHQFVVSNVSGHRVVDEKDMDCPWQEVRPEQLSVPPMPAMHAKKPEYGALIREGRRAALAQLDFESLGGEAPRSRDMPCQSWALASINWSTPQRKPNGENWDGDGTPPEVVLTLQAEDDQQMMSPKVSAYSGTWRLPRLLRVYTGEELLVSASDHDFIARDRIFSESLSVPMSPKGGISFGGGSVELVCVQ